MYRPSQTGDGIGWEPSQTCYPTQIYIPFGPWSSYCNVRIIFNYNIRKPI